MVKNRDKWWKTGEIAGRCGVTKVTVLNWIDKNGLVAFKLPGGHNRVHQDDFVAFLRRHNMPVTLAHQ